MDIFDNFFIEKFLDLFPSHRRLKEHARMDILTGLPNRRSFEVEIERALSHVDRANQALCLAVVDIDHFKKVNDTYGHQGGDAVLKALGTFLAHHMRRSDFPARIGGEEFAILLPGNTIDNAHDFLARLRTTVERLDVTAGGEEIQFTISVGVTEFRTGEGRDVFLKRADDALYDAKRSGRNRVAVA